MPSGWRTAVLLLLLLPAGTQAQSGDGDTDMEPRISCNSHIMTNISSLTCKLIGGRNNIEDDEDYEADGIKIMTACNTDWSTKQIKCVEDFGDTVSSRDLNPLVNVNVTVHLKRGGKITTTVDLKKIVKPRSPYVWNITFNWESYQAVIHIRTPYHNDYLKIDNQLFQLFIWTTGSTTIQNMSSSDSMIIDMERLQKNTEYHIKVRAIPWKYLQGTWSEWGETFTFFTPAEENIQKQTDERREMYTLIVCLVPLVVVTSSVVFFWKNKIFTYMWPNIPHPKHTLVQICKPNKGLLLNFKPEVFSALTVYPLEKTEEQPCEETEPSITAAADDGTQSNHACSTQSSDCSRSTTSVSTEELELSALLSRSSSDGEDSLQSTSLSPINVLQLGERSDTPQPQSSSGGNEAEAYVTMSSFYQIK
ncbi:interleukin-7 receptor subunit alpha isoform X2 [Siniperca chuatsi]|uniref:interleukin-7 receptor subunit alpha isoform X2 n=1 Tax=Siniperca chuatsi TaxID=119488 RepID=UPI001CE07753|nr:interleukin-7 receptor subunit alpha isoform X2 [Siniperca chuatsi]